MKKKVRKFIKNVGYGIFIAVHVLIVWASFHPEFCLKTEVIEEIFFTAVQIVAGLYGTILTGYVFLLSKIDTQVAMNSSLEDVMLSLKQKYKNMIYLITADVLFAFIGVGVSIFYRSEIISIPEWIYWIVTNETLLFMGCVIVFIVYFLNRAIHPKRLEQAAAELKTELDCGKTEAGDAQEFFSTYIEIERICREKIPTETREHLEKYSNANLGLTHKYIRQQRIYGKEICDDLECLRKYHSCLLLGEDLAVSKYICELAKSTLKKMRDK